MADEKNVKKYKNDEKKKDKKVIAGKQRVRQMVAGDASDQGGPLADGLNTVVYLAEGDVKNAIDSGMSAISTYVNVSKSEGKSVKTFAQLSNKTKGHEKIEQVKEPEEILMEIVDQLSKLMKTIQDAAKIAELVKTSLDSVEMERYIEKRANSLKKLREIIMPGKMKTGAKMSNSLRDIKVFESKKNNDKRQILQLSDKNKKKRDGLDRATEYGGKWKWVSLKETIKKFAPNARPRTTSTGKTIYENSETKRSVVYDNRGRYFRVEDTTSGGKANRRYLDENGNPVPTHIGGKLYEQYTHYNNEDERDIITIERKAHKKK